MRAIINGIEWQILFVSPLDIRLFLHESYTLGVTDLSKKIVYIANDLDEVTLRKVLSHELTHCFVYSFNIDTTSPCEEQMCKVVEEYGDDIQEMIDEVFNMII